MDTLYLIIFSEDIDREYAYAYDEIYNHFYNFKNENDNVLKINKSIKTPSIFELIKKWGPDPNNIKQIFSYGSIQSINATKMYYKDKVIAPENFHKYGMNYLYNYSKIPDEYLFNSNKNKKILNFGSLCELHEENLLYNVFSKLKYFIRPEKPTKIFSGQILDTKNINIFINTIKNYIDLQTDIYIFPYQKFISEYRCIVIENKIIDFSHYGNSKNINIDIDYIEKNVSKFIEFALDENICIDIIIDKNMNCKLLKYSCINTAWWYNCDLKLIVKNITQYCNKKINENQKLNYGIKFL